MKNWKKLVAAMFCFWFALFLVVTLILSASDPRSLLVIAFRAFKISSIIVLASDFIILGIAIISDIQ